MVTELDKISVAGFIEVCSGNLSVLAENEEERNDSEMLKECADRLISAYYGITDHAGEEMRFRENYSHEKLRCKLAIYSICKDLIARFDDKDNVRQILNLAKLNCPSNDASIEKAVDAGLARTKYELEKWKLHNRKEEQTEEKPDIKAGFMSQIASLMAFYKMSIDINNTNAMVYANLVAQAKKQSAEMERTIKGMKK